MKAHELEFISIINRDGSGTEPVTHEHLDMLLTNKFIKDDDYEIICLSLTEKTFIAFNFNAYVVRLK